MTPVPTPVGALALGAGICIEVGIAVCLYATTHQAYDSGDSVAFLVVWPIVVLALCAYLLVLSNQNWRMYRLTRQPNTRALWLFATGTTVGVIGLLLALLSGPHIGGVFVIWPLFAQVILFVQARASVRKWVHQLAAHGDTT
jgi:hypothetical protein